MTTHCPVVPRLIMSGAVILLPKDNFLGSTSNKANGSLLFTCFPVYGPPTVLLLDSSVS